MADWFTENAPAENDWFSQNAPGATTADSETPHLDREQSKPLDYYAQPGEMVGQKWIDWFKGAGQQQQPGQPSARPGLAWYKGGTVAQQAPSIKAFSELPPVLPAEALPQYWYGRGVSALAPHMPAALQAATRAVAGLNIGMARAESGFTTPMNIGIAAMPGALPAKVGKAAAGIVSGVFFGQALKGTPEQWSALTEAYNRGDWQGVSEHATTMGASYLPALGILAPFAGKTTESVPPPIPEQYLRPEKAFTPVVPTKPTTAPEAAKPPPVPETQTYKTKSGEVTLSVKGGIPDFIREQYAQERPAPKTAETPRDKEIVQAAETRLAQLEGLPTLSPAELDERDFLIQNRNDPSALAEAFQIGGEEDAISERQATQLYGAVQQPQGTQEGAREVPTDVSGEGVPARRQEPVSTGQPVAAEAPAAAHEPIPPNVAPFVPQIEALRDQGMGRDAIRDAIENRLRGKGFKPEQIAANLRDISKVIKQIVPEAEPVQATPSAAVSAPESAPAAEPAQDKLVRELEEKIRRERNPEKLAAMRQQLAELQAPAEAAPAAEPPAEPVEVKGKRRVAGRAPVDAFGSELTPVASFLMEQGGVVSKTGAKRIGKVEGNLALWDGAPGKWAHPTHGRIYSDTGLMPDEAAAMLADAGLIKEGYADEMWAALDKESQFASRHAKAVRGQERLAKEAESKSKEELKLAAPESMEEQKARTAKEAEVNAELRAEAEKAAQVKYGWAQKKTGTTGDLGQMELESVEAPQEELFSQKAQKLKLRADKEGGFVNPEIFQEAVDFGKRLYGHGMDFVRWSANMVKHLGEAIKDHLASIWRSITGQNILPQARQRGSLSLGGFRPPAWWKPRPDPSSVSGEAIAGAGSAHGIARVYIEEGIAEGKLPAEALAIGIGKTPEQMQAEGIAYINAGHNPAVIIADLKKGIFSPERMAALWAERQRLGAEREAAQVAALRRPGDAKAAASASAAEAAELNFLRTARPLAGGYTQKMMVAWQEAKPLSLLTFDGLYRKAIEITKGEPLTKEQKVELARRADQGLKAKARETAAVKKEIEAGKKVMPRKGPVTEQEMKATMENLKLRLPCT